MSNRPAGLARRHACLSAATALLAAPATPVARSSVARAAQAYPDRPVRVIVPFAPGGGSDTLARFVAPYLSVRWGQPVVIDNRGGAGGAVGTGAAAKAEPDGYTLLVTDSSALTINPWVYERLPYRAEDLAAVTHLATFALVLLGQPGLPAQTLADLVAEDRARPGRLNVATAGNGTSGHLALASLNAAARARLVHVPYRGGGPANTAFLANEVELLFNGLGATTAPFIAAGRAKPFAVTAPSRVPAFPEIPTMAEAGVGGVESVSSQTLFAPAGTPVEILARINANIADILVEAAVVEQWRRFSYLPFVRETPAEVAGWLARESAKWAEVVRANSIRLD